MAVILKKKVLYFAERTLSPWKLPGYFCPLQCSVCIRDAQWDNPIIIPNASAQGLVPAHLCAK